MFKRIIFIIGLCMLVSSISILSGCTSDDWAVVADSLNTANNSFANSFADTTESGMSYTIYNRSSETVYLVDDTGDVTIPPYGSVTARFGKGASVYDVYYTPTYLNVTQSGYSFTFTD